MRRGGEFKDLTYKKMKVHDVKLMFAGEMDTVVVHLNALHEAAIEDAVAERIEPHQGFDH